MEISVMDNSEYQIDFTKPVSAHFVGIGGSSMSGLAELLHKRGFRVSGSEKNPGDSCRRLEELGIAVRCGHHASNITEDIGFVVYTAAVSGDNPELAAARAAGIPTLTRAEFLGQLMGQYKDAISVAGTHGKTTTASMLSAILLEAGMDPTISVGAVLESVHSNSRTGHSEHFVVESCEYRNSFLSFRPAHEIILNIEAEHLDFFRDIDDIRHSFRLFMEKLKEGSHLVIQGDIAGLAVLTEGLKADIATYGIAAQGKTYDYSAENISWDGQGCGSYDLMHGKTALAHVSLGVVGRHNVLNSVAAAAMADLLGVPLTDISNALRSFGGASKRFEKKGEFAGVTVIDDYAHHPTEIRATLDAAANYPHKQIWCVFQPHTFSRTKKLLDDFAEALTMADHVVLADIYPSREEDPGDISSRDLLSKLEKYGKDVHYFPSFGEIENFLLSNCANGDLLITMGAGDIVKVGEELLKR